MTPANCAMVYPYLEKDFSSYSKCKSKSSHFRDFFDFGRSWILPAWAGVKWQKEAWENMDSAVVGRVEAGPKKV